MPVVGSCAPEPPSAFYVALVLDAPAGDADAWGDALLDAGALAVDIADSQAGTAAEHALYAEPGEPAEARWPRCTLSALFGPGVDASAALTAAAKTLGAVFPPFVLREVPEQDWVRRTQSQFAPIEIDERLWIVPSWCKPVDPTALNLVVDPGLAFGTGSHPTTRLCLQWLARELRAGESVLDYGCGSGILAIAASRLGARPVFGVDIDPQAIEASRANAAANAADARFLQPEALATSGAGAFDVVVANILTNPLRLLAPALARRVRPGGRIVLSGILAEQAVDVLAVYGDWFTIGVWKADDGWVALAGTRFAVATG